MCRIKERKIKREAEGIKAETRRKKRKGKKYGEEGEKDREMRRG